MPDCRYVSSAVITMIPGRRDEIVGRIEELADTEIHQIENSKIVVVLQGDDIGGRLARIADIAG